MANLSKRRPRRQFTDEFKAGAVRLVLDEARLRKENRILQEEREILKGAAAFFAKHQA